MPILSRGTLHPISLIVDGVEMTGHAEPRMLLVDFLRRVLGTTGTHVGCEHGICGACTIRLDGKPVRACLLLAVQTDGRRIDTVEGLARRTAPCRSSRMPFTGTSRCSAAFARRACS